MSWNFSILSVALLVILLRGEACFQKRILDDDGGTIVNPDERCVALPSANAPGLGFPQTDGGEPLWVAMEFSPTLLPFDVDAIPPVASSVSSVQVPIGQDPRNHYNVTPSPTPNLTDISFSGSNRGIVTASVFDEVIFFNTVNGTRSSFNVSVPIDFAENDYPVLPLPGATPAIREGLATTACIRATAENGYTGGAIDVDDCDGDPTMDASYYSTNTTGAVIADGRLFASMSNPSSGDGADQDFLPGVVQIYSFQEAPTPNVNPVFNSTNYVFTTSSNPIDLVVHSVPDGDRRVLIASAGTTASGISDRVAATGPSAIEVINAASLVKEESFPLGNAALIGDLVIDPGGRVAVIGSASERILLAIDLSYFTKTPTPVDIEAYVIHNTTDKRFEVKSRFEDETDPDCPEFTRGMAFNDEGDVLYITDFCDGTINVYDVTYGDVPSFSFDRQIELTTEPWYDRETDELNGLGAIAVRPGDPDQDYDGPDVFTLFSYPDGEMCATFVEADEPEAEEPDDGGGDSGGGDSDSEAGDA